MTTPSKLFIGFLVFIYAFALFYTATFTSLDQGEDPQAAEVIIVAEGSIERTYTAIDLLFEGYSSEYKIIESPITPVSLEAYQQAGVHRDELVFEKEASSTWTNATHTIEIMEEAGWDSALVVTTDYHMKRTKLAFERAARGTDLDFTYVSAYQIVDGEPIRYLDHEYGQVMGRSETVKYLAYLFGLYHWIDL